MLSKINNIKKTVEKILRTCPETRDNDRLLMLKVWAAQNPYLRDPQFNFISFSYGFLQQEYADPESIRRTRQKLQEQDPSLRGKVYNGRQNKGKELQYGIN